MKAPVPSCRGFCYLTDERSVKKSTVLISINLPQKARIAKIREHIELSLARNGLFAVLNVGKVIDQIQRLGDKKLAILHEPTQGDPSHSGVYGYQHDDLLVAELIAEIVIEIYLSRQT